MVENTSTVGALIPAVKSGPALSSSEPIAGAHSSDAAEGDHAANTALAELADGGGGGPLDGGVANLAIVDPELDREVLCPICMQVIKDAFLTACGHSFCYMCIVTHLRQKNDCPCCGRFLTTNHLFPNLALDKLLKKVSAHQLARHATPFEQFRRSLSQGCEMSVKDVDSLLSILGEKKRKMEREEAEANMQVVLEFFHCLKRRKLQELNQIQSDLKLIKEDMNVLERQRLDIYRAKIQYLYRRGLSADRSLGHRSFPPAVALPGCEFPGMVEIRNHLSSNNSMSREDNNAPACSKGVASDKAVDTAEPKEQPGSLSERKRRIHSQFHGLQECYLQMRRGSGRLPQQGTADVDGTDTRGCHPGLRGFQSLLSTYTRYSQLKVIAELRNGDLFHSAANIVSSIEFDRDDQHFATAGVSKRIKVFEYSSVADVPAEQVHCPIVEMPTRSKLSCLSWSKCTKNYIASSDYEGVVTVWDIGTRQSLIEYEEHEKRAWCVDFSRSDPTMLVSGSDDCMVKIWCTKQEASALSIDMKANICCVKFNPESSFHVAVGSADHNVHYYDLRNTNEPVHLLTAHKKAVSYVKFLSNNELASASTDSTLRLWDVKENSLVRTYTGHVNEKNFVGMSVNSEYIACGSETNEVVVYHKAVPVPAARHKVISPSVREEEDEYGPFTSAVCWKSDSPVMMAANSQGIIQILGLSP